MDNRAKYVVAIGASAGGLDPIQRLVASLPDDLMQSAFIIAQHLSPSYKSLLTELISKKANARVTTIQEGVPVEGNVIYVTPPDKHVVLEDNCLKFVKNDDIHPKPSINILFNSIADAYKSNAVGIVLSGTGSDGAEGIIAIHEAGGITIAQHLDSCKYTGMPQAAKKTGKSDYFLNPDDIGKHFQDLVLRNYNPDDYDENRMDNGEYYDEVYQILSLLEKRTGVDFRNYKKSTIKRRLEKRMQHEKIKDASAYIKHVVQDPSELEELYKDILIGVTKFYRDKEVYDALHPTLERMIVNHDMDNDFRVWVAGCASGEEVYSLVITILEIARNKGIKHFPLQVFATDIDQKALNFARIGYYTKEVLNDVPKEVIDRYFGKHQSGFIINNDIKKRILFSKHDVTANPPFLKLDFISCRNLLIYFNNELQKQVIPVFHYALKKDGYLLLGKSESVSNSKTLFSTIDQKHKIFLKKPSERKHFSFPQLKPVKKDNSVNSGVYKASAKELTVSEMVKETIYNTYEHPYVVVDENLDMIETHSDTSKYLQFRSGAVSTNILKLIVSDLQIELRALAGQAVKDNKTVVGRLRRFESKDSNKPEFLRLTIKPLLYAKPILPYFVIIFENFDLDKNLGLELKIDKENGEDPKVLQLEQELEATKEHLNTLVEELETSNEELQSTNEELQSSNEELQASNEELETSNEELQATNEELEIAYTEIRKSSDKIDEQRDEIYQFGKRLDALFNSTIQGHILIESNYNIIMFNKTAEECYKTLFNEQLEQGKSYVDYIPTEKFQDFHHKFKEALSGKLSAGVTEYKDGAYYSYNYIPITNSKGVKSGSVLISFHDVTKEKRAEKKLRKAYKEAEEQKQLWHKLFVNAPINIAIFNYETHKIEYVNPNLQSLYSEENFRGRSILDIIPNNRHEVFKQTIHKVIASGDAFNSLEVPLKFEKKRKNEPYKYFNINCSILKQPDDSTHIVIYATDVTQQVEARKIKETSHELVQAENEKFIRLFDEAPLFIAKTSGEKHKITYANPYFRNYFANRTLVNKSIEKALPEIMDQNYTKVLNHVYSSGSTYIGEEIKILLKDKNSKDFHEGYYTLVCHPRKNKSGEIEGVTLIGYEVTDLIKARLEIQQRADYLFMLSELMPQKVFTCTGDGKNDYINSQLKEYCGLEDDALIEDGWKSIVHKTDLENTRKEWKEAIENKVAFQVKHRIKSQEGSYFWHLTRAVPVIGDSGKINKWIGTSTDIHEQITSEKRKDEFLNIASHELKTPLTTIIAYTELLKDLPHIKDDKAAFLYVSKSLRNQNKLKDLISELLDVTRIQSGKLSLVKKEVNYKELIESIIDNITHVYPSHNIIVKGDLKTTIAVDEPRLEQIISNLISNAVKYSPESVKIIVNLEEKENKIITSVTDFGKGIPKNKQKYIFNRFYRVNYDDTSTTGLGIGLYITAQLVEAHNGTIWLKSELGQGSTFMFSLPLKEV